MPSNHPAYAGKTQEQISLECEHLTVSNAMRTAKNNQTAFAIRKSLAVTPLAIGNAETSRMFFAAEIATCAAKLRELELEIAEVFYNNTPKADLIKYADDHGIVIAEGDTLFDNWAEIIMEYKAYRFSTDRC